MKYIALWSDERFDGAGKDFHVLSESPTSPHLTFESKHEAQRFLNEQVEIDLKENGAVEGLYHIAAIVSTYKQDVTVRLEECEL